MNTSQDTRITFSIAKGALSVSASVSSVFFDEKVLPVMESILLEMKSGRSPVDAASNSTAAHTPEIDLSVKMIASKLNARLGSDVLKAAVISLALVHGRVHFSRKEILTEAQKATGYWKRSITNNASKYLETLLSAGFIIESSTGQLSLSASGEAEARNLLT